MGFAAYGHRSMELTQRNYYSYYRTLRIQQRPHGLDEEKQHVREVLRGMVVNIVSKFKLHKCLLITVDRSFFNWVGIRLLL